ncbi:hypothetical protein [Desulforhabdus amnigena]|jgi:hypothetical protein|uniref:Uncharacterized protein n=1 Tax=Desulforhabdus amnigena TaxID=40218 RepID=A0A9W6FVB5_9BACT|nr:hypothetical protein [Desulforhabdus amnigena]GLI35513.1 hypothetical protein DAMNIGENAA_29460 [Desulforhabdus amnigena]
MIDRSKVTLYSGGLKGAEAEFGANAEAWGIREVNFTFVGHEMDRVKSVKFLTEEELQKGDISMEIVYKRMGRTYTTVEKIRRVMQSIFHMVNNGYQVFAVGWIKDNDTVKGGTGWGVELAKFFNRPVSVYDQDKKQWFSWENNQWVPDTPVVSHDTFAGTGTRYLTDDGRQAIRDLFERSFGAADNPQ